MNKQKILQAGKIASEAREYARKNIKKGMKLIDIANMIEDKMAEINSKAKPAFPTCLSVDDVAAHATPAYNDERVAEGILKIDMGVHIDGWIADTAFSLDLEDSEDNKKIITASENALGNVIKIMKKEITLKEIGKTVYETMIAKKLNPITNLFGHSINHYSLHSKISIPNYDNGSNTTLSPGLYAVEPFATNGMGRVHDGKPSGIYRLINDKNIRSPIAREVLEFIKKEFVTLPFCSRWVIKTIGSKALIGLKQLEENENIYQYAELIESAHGKVSQTEHTILIEENGNVIVTTE
jgi:methionyl aminopeptidase